MAKHKSIKEMMDEKNTLQRPTVTPVNLYEQPTEQATVAGDAKKSTPAAEKGQAKKVKVTADDPVVPYSSYIKKSQLKGIKLRAIDRGVKDKVIVQEALDEYFKKHPL